MGMDGVWGKTQIDFGDYNKGAYKTSYGESFYNKGDPNRIRARLDQDAKKNLRQTNFSYGMRPVRDFCLIFFRLHKRLLIDMIFKGERVVDLGF